MRIEVLHSQLAQKICISSPSMANLASKFRIEEETSRMERKQRPYKLKAIRIKPMREREKMKSRYYLFTTF